MAVSPLYCFVNRWKMLPIGQTLAAARESRGLSVEDAAHRTRIHPKLLESLEAGDYSVFPSPAYAKSFVRSYSQFLGIDLSESMDDLPQDGTVSGTGRSATWFSGWSGKIRNSGTGSFIRPKRRASSRKKAPLLLNGALGFIILSMSLFYYLGFSSSSLEEVQDRLKMTGEALIPSGKSDVAPDGAQVANEMLALPPPPVARDAAAASRPLSGDSPARPDDNGSKADALATDRDQERSPGSAAEKHAEPRVVRAIPMAGS